MSYVIVCKEKHGDFYYDASTDEAFAESALAILTNRWNEGYWYYDPDETDKETREWRPEILMETVLGEDWPGWDVPENDRVAAINKRSNDLKAKMDATADADEKELLALKRKKLSAAVEEYKWRRDYRKWYAEAKVVVETQDLSTRSSKSGRFTYPRAWWLLADRSDHEYEGVELERLQGKDD